jgi:hypothetical protein
MKIKEYPPSFARIVRLQSYTARRLRNGLGAQASGPVVVSLTSIQPRLKFAHLAIRSVLAQSEQAEQILLWLDHACRDRIPPALAQLTGARFDIRFCDDVGPHTKLVYALRDFPSKLIVTCDDDLMYHRDWLKGLLLAHNKFPSDVIGNQCRTVRYRDDGTLCPYRQWHDEVPGESHPNTLPLGYAGVLYPPGALAAIATDSTLFRQLSPKADDLWFKAMSLLAGTRARRSPQPGPKPYPIPFSQQFSLQKSNVRADGNCVQWAALAKHFGFDALLS